MKRFTFFLLIPALGALVSCHRQDRAPQSVVWTKNEGPAPAIFSSPQFAQKERSVWVLGEIVHVSDQHWGPATVEGGSLKIIENAHGEKSYGKAQFLFSPEESQAVRPEDLEQLQRERYLFLEKLKKRLSWRKPLVLMSEPSLMVLVQNRHPQPAYVLDYYDPDSMQVIRRWISPTFKILKREIVSSDFQAMAWVFTADNHSILQEVLLRNMLEAPLLKSQHLQVSSQSPQNASAHEVPWKFALDDPRFDQLQAFYFLQEGLDFFSSELGFSFPVTVQAETSIGYPEKTNAAFTYNNQIHFGSGDSQAYNSMARDPSIVIHELGHILVGLIARLPSQGEGGSLNEGFADFFAASHLKSPKMGSYSYLLGPYKRTLEQKILFPEKNGGLYHDSLIVSGTLWELRDKIGSDKTQKLALKTLARLSPADTLKDFAVALRAAAPEILNKDEIMIMNQTLGERQWPD